MPEAFLSLTSEEQGDILNTCAERTGRAAAILEKDIWICWVLQTLFSIPGHLPMVFKGGTSLSKGYRIIDRFSEDVDVTLDYKALIPGFDPFAKDVTKTKNKKFSEALKSCVDRQIREGIVPALKAASEKLVSADHHDIRVDDDGEKVWFAYPSTVENPMAYLKTDVLLEFGGRNAIDPHEPVEITPDIAKLTDHLDYPKATIAVLSPKRTFWEKATLIHVECHRRRLAASPERLSRHWFDLVSLAGHDMGRAALENRALLEDVVRYKTVFFNSSYAHYDHCLNGRLRLVPDKDQLTPLKSDYDAMRAASIIRPDAPKFDVLIDQIREIETEANRLSAEPAYA